MDLNRKLSNRVKNAGSTSAHIIAPFATCTPTTILKTFSIAPIVEFAEMEVEITTFIAKSALAAFQMP